MIPIFVQGALLGISAALSPGPFQSLIIAESLVGGWRRAAPITFAPLIADIPIAGILVFTLTQVPGTFLVFVRLAGGVFLLFLAWQLWGQIQEGPCDDPRDRAEKRRSGFLWGVLMLFLSPGPYLFWSLINGPILLEALDLSIWHAIVFLASFYFFSIGGLISIAYVLSRLGGLNRHTRRKLQVSSLVLMLVIALFLIQQGLFA